MHYRTHDGREILDGVAGLWCVNAGHCRQQIVEAIQRAGGASWTTRPTFQMGHPLAFELADAAGRPAAGRPRPRVLHQLRLGGGRHRAEDRARLSPRPRRGHAHAADRPRARLSRRRLRRHLGRRHGRQPQVLRPAAAGRRPSAAHPRPRAATPSPAASRAWGAQLADELERLVALHDASTIAAVIVEPVAGSTGVLIAAEGLSAAAARDLRQARHPADLRRGDHRLRPPGRAVRRRAIRRHAGHDHAAPRASPTARCRWARCSCASDDLRRLHGQGAGARDRAVPRLHLFRPSAGLRRGPRHARDSTRTRACSSAPPSWRRYCEEAVHRLRGAPHVIDIRNLGLVGRHRAGAAPRRSRARAPSSVFVTLLRATACWSATTGDIIALSPPLIVEKRRSTRSSRPSAQRCRRWLKPVVHR